MLDRVIAFTEALRRAGIPVSVSEDIDAVQALVATGLKDRPTTRAAMAATLIKNSAHRPQFDTLFDLHFLPGDPGSAAEEAPFEPSMSDESFRDQVLDVMLLGDAAGTRAFAREAVLRWGRIENSPSGGGFFQYPVFKALDIESLLARVQDEPDTNPLQEQLRRDALGEQAKILRATIAAEVRRRVAQRKGPDAVARSAVRDLPEDINLLTAATDDLAAIRQAIQPLARKLATRLSMKRRRARRGTLDIRRTIRHSLSTGGAPMDLAFKKRPPHRPELFVLCDISDSVSRFARFSLMLVHALGSQFTRVRTFVFIDTLDEVTRIFEHEDFFTAADRVATDADVVQFDGHSDYGTSLKRFWERCEKDIDSRSTILILGDARNNFRNPRSETLKEIRKKAHRVYWLNPEPEGFWDTGDSAVSGYLDAVDGMVEVRNLRQLEEFISRTL